MKAAVQLTMMEDNDFQQTDPDTNVEVPDDPGPALMGKTPLVGSVRRGLDMPVIREELKGFNR